MKYLTYTWDMVLALQSASPASWKTTPTFINSIRPKKQPEKKKERRNEIQLPTNRIVLPWPMSQNPGLKEVDLEPNPKRGSNKINMLK